MEKEQQRKENEEKAKSEKAEKTESEKSDPLGDILKSVLDAAEISELANEAEAMKRAQNGTTQNGIQAPFFIGPTALLYKIWPSK